MAIIKHILPAGLALAGLALLPSNANANPAPADLNAVITLFSNAATAGTPCQTQFVTNSGDVVCNLGKYTSAEIGRHLNFQIIVQKGSCRQTSDLLATPVGLKPGQPPRLCQIDLTPFITAFRKVPLYSTECRGAVSHAKQAGKLSGKQAGSYLNLCDRP